MPVKKRSSAGVLVDPRMGLQQRRAQCRRLRRVVERRIRRITEGGRGTAARLASLRHMGQMLADEIARLDIAIDALEDHGAPHQVRIPGSGERIRLYRSKRR